MCLPGARAFTLHSVYPPLNRLFSILPESLRSRGTLTGLLEPGVEATGLILHLVFQRSRKNERHRVKTPASACS